MGSAATTGLRDARRNAGLSQAELAGRAGVRAATVSDIERGVERPTFRVAVRLASACGLTVSEVFDPFGLWPGSGPSPSRRLRSRQGWSQVELARRAGVGLGVIRRMEQGTAPLPHNAAAVAAVLGVKVTDLLPDSGEGVL